MLNPILNKSEKDFWYCNIIIIGSTRARLP